jgi:8-oxo-dGTP pyrophosphatase MutT (NUDIX family)
MNMGMKTFYVGVKGIVIDEERGALLLHREYKSGDFWDMPGGRMDDDEDFKDTLTRELSEELPGVKVQRIGDLLGAHRVHKDIDGNVSLVLLYFSVTAKLPDPVQLSEEHSGYKWVKTQHDIPEGVNEQVMKILREVLPV